MKITIHQLIPQILGKMDQNWHFIKRVLAPSTIRWIKAIPDFQMEKYRNHLGKFRVVNQSRSQMSPSSLHGYIKPENGDIGILNFVHPGYYRAREFYTPNYDIPDDKHSKPDYRSTLYWNPNIVTNESGEAEFDFYTSDEKGNYCLQIQGLSFDGRPVTGSYYFSVE